MKSYDASCLMQQTFCLFAICVWIASSIPILEAATHQHSLLNTPPILHVSERNWRISETTPVGQVISRIRADDTENDELVFGLEPHFHSNYANPNDDLNTKGTIQKLPFRIDPIEGVVYLNESLIGRGGENFFLYITVFDGQLTAKNEVFVNILKPNRNGGFFSRMPPLISNISNILPPFSQLPGVQSIGKEQLNGYTPFTFPSNFPQNNPPIFQTQYSNQSDNNSPNRKFLSNTKFNLNQNFENLESNEQNLANENRGSLEDAENESISTTKRTKLLAISEANNEKNPSNTSATLSPQSNTNLYNENITVLNQNEITPNNLSNSYSFKAIMIPFVIAFCGLFGAAAAIFGYVYRKRLCAMGKILKKKTKEDMVKESNQSSSGCNLSDDSRNTSDMQQWSGPIVYGNRYVPWQRDQQLMQIGALSTSVFDGNVSSIGTRSGIPNATINNISEHNLSGKENKCDVWEFPRYRLKFFNILGEGAFGQVWRCEATDIDSIEGVTTVAVKTLKENATEMEKKDLMSELEVMKSLEPHVNVVRFLGCCTDKDPIFVIIEYVNRGKLQTYLRNSRAEGHYGNTHGKSNVLTSGQLTSFMHQIAKGMDYLTSRGIIHRDLAARNILITQDHTCKVADFGFARDVITTKIYERKSEGKLPIRWMAIESLYDNIFSTKSDIWSFGILMWEIVTLGSTPYPGIAAADVMRKVRDGYRLEKPEHCRRELYNIMYYCWSQQPEERPMFSEIVEMLDKLLHNEMDYIELERFPDHNYYNITNVSDEKL